MSIRKGWWHGRCHNVRRGDAEATARARRRLDAGILALACCVVALSIVAQRAASAYREKPPGDPPPARRLIPHGIGVIDVTRHCLYSVPRTWRVDERPGLDALTWAPDGMVSAEQEFHPESSWTAYTSRLRRRLSPTVVHDDGATRFWVEHAGAWPGIHHFVAVPSTGGVCATQIDLNGRADDLLKQTVRQIVRSVGALE